MAYITIHNIESFKIEKYQLDSGTWVCKIVLSCKVPISNKEFSEEICLFSDTKDTFKNFK